MLITILVCGIFIISLILVIFTFYLIKSKRYNDLVNDILLKCERPDLSVGTLKLLSILWESKKEFPSKIECTKDFVLLYWINEEDINVFAVKSENIGVWM